MTKSNWLKATALFAIPIVGWVAAPAYILRTILKKEKRDVVQVRS